jgi:hypothetical protein
MTTLAKIEANRRNGQLSTGPRTEEGKAIVARNAARHGIFASVPVIPGESAEEWEAHRAGVVDSLGPVGLLEVNLAERAALQDCSAEGLLRYTRQGWTKCCGQVMALFTEAPRPDSADRRDQSLPREQEPIDPTP